MPVFTDLEAEGLQHAILPQRGVFAVATDALSSRWSTFHFNDKVVLKQMSCAELADDVNQHELREAAARAMYLATGNPDMADLADREDQRGDEARDELCEKCNFNGQYREHCGIHGAGLI